MAQTLRDHGLDDVELHEPSELAATYYKDLPPPVR